MPISLATVDEKQEAVLQPPPNIEWPWGGLEYVGGLVTLGDNADELRKPSEKNNLEPTEIQMRARLGGLLLASVGMTGKEIARQARVSQDYLEHEILEVKSILPSQARYMMLGDAVGRKILNIARFGSEQNFQATNQELIKLGLLAKVSKDYVLSAFGIEYGALNATMTRLSNRTRVRRMAGCITAAMMTHQIGPRTGIPLRQSDGPDGDFEPILPPEDWNSLIAAETKEDFVSLFKEYQLERM